MKKILLYKGKLVEEVGYTVGEKVLYLKYVKTEDMPKCKCGEPIDEEITIIEGCRNYKENCEAVETITKNRP